MIGLVSAMAVFIAVAKSIGDDQVDLLRGSVMRWESVPFPTHCGMLILPHRLGALR